MEIRKGERLMARNLIEKDIIDTGVRITLERNYYKKWNKSSVKRMLTALDIAKEFQLEDFEDWEGNRATLTKFLHFK
jgi:hypothetical protein